MFLLADTWGGCVLLWEGWGLVFLVAKEVTP